VLTGPALHARIYQKLFHESGQFNRNTHRRATSTWWFYAAGIWAWGQRKSGQTTIVRKVVKVKKNEKNENCVLQGKGIPVQSKGS
jgi:hypothetical protein